LKIWRRVAMPTYLPSSVNHHEIFPFSSASASFRCRSASALRTSRGVRIVLHAAPASECVHRASRPGPAPVVTMAECLSFPSTTGMNAVTLRDNAPWPRAAARPVSLWLHYGNVPYCWRTPAGALEDGFARNGDRAKDRLLRRLSPSRAAITPFVRASDTSNILSADSMASVPGAVPYDVVRSCPHRSLAPHHREAL